MKKPWVAPEALKIENVVVGDDGYSSCEVEMDKPGSDEMQKTGMKVADAAAQGLPTTLKGVEWHKGRLFVRWRSDLA